jgi:hypothetical protein
VERNQSPMLPRADILKTHSETFADALRAFPSPSLIFCAISVAGGDMRLMLPGRPVSDQQVASRRWSSYCRVREAA